MEGGQASESAVFSLPVRTRSEELEHAQLLESSKNMKKIGIREKQKTFKERGVVAGGSVTSTDSPSSHGNAILADKNMTNVLLQLLVTEITSVRCTLESLAQTRAQNEALLAEIQTSNRLLALLLTSGHTLESFNYHIDHAQLVKMVQEKAKQAEVVLNIV